MTNFADLWTHYCGNANIICNNCSSTATLSSLLLKDFHFWSACSEDASMTFTYTVFLLLFCCNLIVKWGRQPRLLTKIRHQRSFYIFLSAVCVLLGIFHLGLGLISFLHGTRKWGFHLNPSQYIRLLIEGLWWISLGYTLTFRTNSSIEKAFLRGSWSITFVLGTIEGIFAVTRVLKTDSISVLEILSFVSWPVACLMLACTVVKDLRNAQFNQLSQPLLRNSLDSQEQVVNGSSYNNVSCRDVTVFAEAGILSKMTFWWLNPLLSKGRKRALEEEDLPRVCVEDQTETNYIALSKQMRRIKNEKPCSNPSVFWGLFYNEKRNLAVTGFFAFLKVCSMSCGPIVLNAFIGFSQGKQTFKYEGFALAAMLFALKLSESLAQRQWYFGTRRIGLQIRSALVATIYEKQLKLSHQARQLHTAGEINNYVAVDAYRIGEFPFWIHQTWTTSLQLILALLILYFTIGWATVAALLVIIITVLCNSPLAKLQHKFQSELMSAQDQRLRATTEALSHIKVLKLHAWETRFKENIEQLRNIECKWLAAVQYRKAYATLLFWASPVLVSTVTFAACYLIGVPLTASNVFTFIASFRLVQEPIRVIPDVIGTIIQAKVSLNRIDKFLEASELQKDAVEHTPYQSSEKSIIIRSAILSWDINTLKPTLKNINLEVGRGQKVAICGEVGSGKSTMLAAILGEVPKLQGQLQVWGSIAYVSQTAWIQTGTVQDNILFGRPLHREKYQEVIVKCSLVKDFQNFPFGDQTEIGERGANLSGGQKQRIQLARALYQDADIYLLDDPFSAVDADTATSLFTEYMMEALSNKTVILVTHLVDFLPAFDIVLLMADGEISQSGKYQDLIDSSRAFRELVNAHKDAVAKNGSNQIILPAKKETGIKHGEIQKIRSRKEQWTSLSSGSLKGDQLIKQEEKEVGDPGLQPYILYVKQNKGFFYYTLAVLTHSLFIVCQLSQNSWMASKVESPAVGTAMLIAVYSAIGFISLLFLLIRGIFVVTMGLNASKSFFSVLLTSLIRAPMAFYDSTPLGRVFSRVSSDLNLLDVDIPITIIFATAATLNALSTIGVIAVVTWQVLFLVVPMLYLVVQIQRYYFSSAKELMRMNGTTKSPIANHLGESISGAMTIRAFKVEDQFFKKNLVLTDKNASPFFHTFSAAEWLIQRLEVLSATLLSCSALTVVLLPKGSFHPGFVGMALSYGLSLNMSLVFSIQNQCTLSNYIVSVERIKQYMHIPSEAPEVIEDNRPPIDWPSQGKVELQNLQIRYRSNRPLVLCGITCTFEAGHKIGIVGRTGSGKTTLISAIFRLVEPADGRIIIDNLDIGMIGLHDLRSRIGIIPQEPTLFNGTVRFNLDPLSEHSDMAIWEALNKCQLGDVIREKEDGLDAIVGDDGENWSVGQRQLFCLGRALLRRSKILVLDEATASIDNATDAIIQATIRTEFKGSTVITVAHRIPTVMDSDMVLAISDGQMVEYDNPSKLVENEGSLFAKLVSEYWSHTSNALIHTCKT